MAIPLYKIYQTLVKHWCIVDAVRHYKDIRHYIDLTQTQHVSPYSQVLGIFP